MFVFLVQTLQNDFWIKILQHFLQDLKITARENLYFLPFDALNVTSRRARLFSPLYTFNLIPLQDNLFHPNTKFLDIFMFFWKKKFVIKGVYSLQYEKTLIVSLELQTFFNFNYF